MQQRGESDALQALALMQQGRGIEPSSLFALSTARLSLEYRLSMADSMILVSAKAHGATLWTQYSDFDGVSGVKYNAKKSD